MIRSGEILVKVALVNDDYFWKSKISGFRYGEVDNLPNNEVRAF